MGLRLDAVEERREQERLAEPGVAAAAGRPGGQAATVAPRLGVDRAADGRVALGVGVEEQARPVGSRERAGNEVGDGRRARR